MMNEIWAVTKFYWKKHFASTKGVVLVIIFLSLPLVIGIAFGSANDSNIQTIYVGDFNSWKFVLTFDLTSSLFLGQFGAIAAIVSSAYMFGEGYSEHEFLYEISFPVSRKQHFVGRTLASVLVSSAWTAISYLISIIYLYLVGCIKFKEFSFGDFLKTIGISVGILFVIILINMFYLGITVYGSTSMKQVNGPLIFMILYIILIDSLVDLGWPYVMQILHKNWPKYLVLQYHLDKIREYILGILVFKITKWETSPILTILVFLIIGIGLVILGYNTFEKQDL